MSIKVSSNMQEWFKNVHNIEIESIPSEEKLLWRKKRKQFIDSIGIVEHWKQYPIINAHHSTNAFSSNDAIEEKYYGVDSLYHYGNNKEGWVYDFSNLKSVEDPEIKLLAEIYEDIRTNSGWQPWGADYSNILVRLVYKMKELHLKKMNDWDNENPKPNKKVELNIFTKFSDVIVVLDTDDDDDNNDNQHSPNIVGYNVSDNENENDSDYEPEDKSSDESSSYSDYRSDDNDYLSSDSNNEDLENNIKEEKN